MFKTLWSLQGVMVGCAVMVLSHFAIENADANEWRVISELPTQRAEFATAVVDSKIYLIGGTLFENNRDGPFGMSLVEVYDPEANTWQRLADMPTVRSSATAAVVDGKIYVLAGQVGKRGVHPKSLKVVEMYDPQTDTWVRKQDMSLRRAAFGSGWLLAKSMPLGGMFIQGTRNLRIQDASILWKSMILPPILGQSERTCRHDAMALGQRLFGTPFTPSVGRGGH